MVNKRLLNYIGNTGKHIFLAVMARWIRLISNIAFSVIFAYILSAMLTGSELAYGIPAIAGSLIVILTVRYFSTLWGTKENSRVVDEVKSNLRKTIYEKILSLGPKYINEVPTAKVIQIGVEGVEQLETYYGGYITQLYYSFISAVTLFATVAYFSLKVGIVILIVSPVIPLLLTVMLKVVRNIQAKYWNSYADVGILFLDSLQGLTTLKLYKADEDRAAQMDEQAENFRKRTMRVLKMQLNSITLVNLMCYGGAAAAVIITLKETMSGKLSVFGCLLIVLLAAEFFIALRQLTSLFHVAMGGVAAGEKILEFLDSEVEEHNGTEDFESEVDINIKNLNFSYEGEDKKILKDISFNVKDKGFVALVGVSGCGKSTIASILAGQLSVDDGMVFFGDTDINKVSRKNLVKNITKVTHNGHIFRGTVRSNLQMAKSDATDDEMIKVLREVSMWDFLSEQDGLDTKVESAGTNLSGGQAQRLSLARALLHDSVIYIFDEAASNVDVESEEIILDAIRKISKEKTVIYISHRLKSIMAADRIYVMEKGKIVEAGKHEELMGAGGLYSALFTEQQELEDFRSSKGISSDASGEIHAESVLENEKERGECQQ